MVTFTADLGQVRAWAAWRQQRPGPPGPLPSCRALRDASSPSIRRAQGEELEPARAKAEKMGVKQIFIDDLREEFVRDYVFPMFRCAPPAPPHRLNRSAWALFPRVWPPGDAMGRCILVLG